MATCSIGRLRYLPLLLALCLVIAAASPAWVAAQINNPGVETVIPRPGDRPLPEPDFDDPPAPKLQLPPVRKPADPGKLSAGPRVFVKTILLSGNTVFSQEELALVTGPYEGREITNQELQELRHRLTLYYVERGYINSGAVIPDQRVGDGVIKIDIIEGRLTAIEIGGNKRLRSRYLSSRLERGATVPVNTGELQKQLQLMLQDPLIERINANLAPGLRPGEAILRAQVAESRPYDLGLGIDNHMSPSVGEVQGLLSGGIGNLTGWGDRLSASGRLADGLHSFSVGYSVPLNARETRLSLSFDRSDSDVVEEPFDIIDIESETDSASVQLAHPLFREPGHHLELGLSFDARSSKTFLLGMGSSFAPGVPRNGESDVSVLRFSQDWLRRDRRQVFAARSTFSVGIDVLDATINNGGPDGEFVTWLAQFQWARRIGERGDQLVFRLDGQYAFDPLLPLEQFAVGGANSVRGYRSNQLVRDHGAAASIEYRIPLKTSASGRHVFQIAPFIDGGGAWNRGRDTPSPKGIAGIGLGLRWDPTERIHAELYWGHALEDTAGRAESLQDDGVHFRLSARLF